MTPRTGKFSALRLVALFLLFSANLFAFAAQAANPATISSASWRAADVKLVVKGKRAHLRHLPPG
jgi:hypothetical protein